jgi:hypothetical protein
MSSLGLKPEISHRLAAKDIAARQDDGSVALAGYAGVGAPVDRAPGP